VTVASPGVGSPCEDRWTDGGVAGRNGEETKDGESTRKPRGGSPYHYLARVKRYPSGHRVLTESEVPPGIKEDEVTYRN